MHAAAFLAGSASNAATASSNEPLNTRFRYPSSRTAPGRPKSVWRCSISSWSPKYFQKRKSISSWLGFCGGAACTNRTAQSSQYSSTAAP